MRIGITFAVFNRLDFTRKCLTSIYANGSQNELLVVVVDNGSSDGTVEALHKEFPAVQIVQNNANLGCAKAWNQGIDACREQDCDFIFLTQNDVIISHGCIDRCVNFLLENERFDLVSPTVINVPYTSGYDLNQEQLDKIAAISAKRYADNVGPNFIFYFFAMRASIANRFRFDEHFVRALYEDADYYNSLRLAGILSCHRIGLGLIFHRYNTTQVIAHNSDPFRNKMYFEAKWANFETELRRRYDEYSQKVSVKIEYPVNDLGLYLDVEKAGLHMWDRP